MKYLTFIMTILSMPLFSGVENIQKKYEEIYQIQKDYKPHPTFKTFDDDYIYRQGILEGLKFALENLD